MFLLNTGAAAAVAVQLTEKDVTWLVDFPVDPSMVSLTWSWWILYQMLWLMFGWLECRINILTLLVGWWADWHEEWVVLNCCEKEPACWLYQPLLVCTHSRSDTYTTFDCPSTWTLHGKFLSVACEFQHHLVFTWVLLVFLRCRHVLLTLIRLLSTWPLGTVVLFFRMGGKMEKGSTSESWICLASKKHFR